MPIDDITDARFFADEEIRKLVDEINREFRRINLKSPFEDIDVSNGKELNKEIKEILTNTNELNKIINQIKANSASVKGTGGRGRELDAINNKTNQLTNNLNLLANTFNDFQKAIENTTNNIRFAQQTINDSETGKYQEGSLEQIGESVLSDNGVIEDISVGVAEEVVKGIGKGLTEDLGGYVGQNILKESVFKGVDDVLSKHGVDVNKIISDGLGLNKEIGVDELISKEVYSQLLTRGAPDDVDDPYSNTKLRDSYITYEDFIEGTKSDGVSDAIKETIASLDGDELTSEIHGSGKDNVPDPDILPMANKHDYYVRYPTSNATGEVQYDSIDWRKTRKGYPQGWRDNADIELGFPSTWGEGEYSAKSVFELMNRLKKNYGEIIEIANRAGVELPNAFTKILEWDENGDLSPFSKNIEILYDLLDGGKLDTIISQMNKSQWKTSLPRKVFSSDNYDFGWDKRDDLSSLLGREVTNELKNGRKNVENPQLRDVKTRNIEGQANKFDEVKKDAVRLREIFDRFWGDTIIVGDTTSGTIRRALEGVEDLEKRKEIIEKLTGERFGEGGIAKSFAYGNEGLVESLPNQFSSGIITLPGGKSFDVWNDLIYDTFSQELLEIDVNEVIMDEFKSAIGDYIRPKGYRKNLPEEDLKEIYKLENWKQTPTAEDISDDSLVGKHREVGDLTESFVELVEIANKAGIDIPENYKKLAEEIDLLKYAGRLDNLTESVTDLGLKYSNLLRIIDENDVKLPEDLKNLFDLIRESNPQGWNPQISMKDAKGEDGYDEAFNPGTFGVRKRGRKLIPNRAKDGNWVDPEDTILTNDTIDLTEPRVDPNAPVEDNSKILLDENGLPVTKISGEPVIVISDEEMEELINSKIPGMANSIVEGDGEENEGGEDEVEKIAEAFSKFFETIQNLHEVFDGMKMDAEKAMEGLLKNMFVDKSEILKTISKNIYSGFSRTNRYGEIISKQLGQISAEMPKSIYGNIGDTIGKQLADSLKDIDITAQIKPESLNIGDGANVTIMYAKGAFEGAGNVYKDNARPTFNIPNPFFDENGESIFLKMVRGSLGVVDMAHDKTRPSYMSGGEWEDYGERVDDLTILQHSKNPKYRAFAMNSLGEAISMRDEGFRGRIRNQDLIRGLFGGDLPELANFSFEDYAYYAKKYQELSSKMREISPYTKEELDKKIGDIDKKIQELKDTGPSGDRGGMNNLQIQKEIDKLIESKNNLLENYNKTFLEKDDLTYLKLLAKVYGSLASGRTPYRNLSKELDKYLSVIDKGYFESGKSISVNIAKLITDAQSVGADISNIIEKSIDNTRKNISEYKDKLKNTSSLAEKRTIAKKIDALVELLNFLEKLMPESVELPSSIPPHVSFSTFLPYMFSHVSMDEEGNQNYNNLFDLVPDDVKIDADPNASVSFTAEDLIKQRFELLQKKYVELSQILEKWKPIILNPNVSKEAVEYYDNLVKRVNYVQESLIQLSQKNTSVASEMKSEVDDLIKKYGQLGLTVNELKGQEGLEQLMKHRGAGLGLGEAIENVSSTTTSSIKPATSDFEKFSRNFDYATRSVQGLQNGLITLFKIVGSGNAVIDMTTASSLRQTNKIMLGARRGQEEADKLYDKIQALVVELPGNDTFLTNILTMLGTMDESLSGSDLEYMGGVIADYYMAAQAKGQFNNETERELRNYLMTGQTRNLTNSVIASEVESLKGLNSVKERTIALEKALKNTGMDSIAHYDSYTNTFEEFKGRFQKSFADLGDLYLGFLQLLMKVYNFLDRISGSLLSQFTIIGGVGLLSLTLITMALGRLLGAVGNVSNGINSMKKFMFGELPEGTDKYTRKIQDLIRQLGVKIGVMDADTYATLTNAGAKTVNADASYGEAVAEEVSIWAKIKGRLENIKLSLSNMVLMWSKFKNMETTSLETIAEEGNTEAKIVARLAIYKQTLARWLHTISVWAEEGSLWENTKAHIINTYERIKSWMIEKWETITKWAHIIATNAQTVATWLLNGALAVLNLLLSPIGFMIIGIVVALYAFYNALMAVGNAFGWFNDFGSMIDAISAGIDRIWNAFMNSEQVQDALYIINGFIQNVMALFSDVGGGLMEAIFGVSGSREWDIVADIINVLGAIGGFLYWLSPLEEILDVIRAIGAYIGWVMTQWNKFIDSSEFGVLIDDFKELWGLVAQVWNELKPLFEETWNAIAEMFGGGESSLFGEDGDELFELLKAVAQFIHDIIMPVLKVTIPNGVRIILGIVLVVFKIVQVLFTIIYQGIELVSQAVKVLSDVLGSFFGGVFSAISTVVGGIMGAVNWLVEKLEWVADKFGWLLGMTENNDKKPVNIANQEGGYNTVLNQNYLDTYAKGKDLAKNYVNTSSNATVINNNFAEGSVQADARNWSKKDVQKMFTSAFGYNEARGVKGVVR